MIVRRFRLTAISEQDMIGSSIQTTVVGFPTNISVAHQLARTLDLDHYMPRTLLSKADIWRRVFSLPVTLPVSPHAFTGAINLVTSFYIYAAYDQQVVTFTDSSVISDPQSYRNTHYTIITMLS